MPVLVLFDRSSSSVCASLAHLSSDRCIFPILVASGLTEPQAVKFLFLMTLALGMGALNLAHASVVRSLWTATYSTVAAVLVVSGMRVGTQWNGGRTGSNAPLRRPTEAAESL